MSYLSDLESMNKDNVQMLTDLTILSMVAVLIGVQITQSVPF